MITSIDSVCSLFSFIQDKLLRPKYYSLNEANKVVKYDIAERMQQAEKRLLAYDSDVATIDNGVKSPETILCEWRIFDRNFDGDVTDGYKLSYNLLIDQTRCLSVQKNRLKDWIRQWVC